MSVLITKVILLYLFLYFSILPPGTPHFVLTIRPTIAYGQHFYNPNIFLHTFYSYITTFIANDTITNASSAVPHLSIETICLSMDAGAY